MQQPKKDMTQERKEELIDSVKSWLFPAMMALCVYFLSQLYNKIDEINTMLIELKIEQRVTQSEIIRLKTDTTELSQDINELKKTVQIEY